MAGSEIGQSKKIAVGGIFAAFSLMIMMFSWIGLVSYIVPLFAGLVLLIISEEINRKWAIIGYVCVGILSLLLVNPESAMLFIAFFGYYPIIKGIYDSKIKNKLLRWIIKIINFALCVTLSFAVTTIVFLIPLNESGAVTTVYIITYAACFTFMFFFQEIMANEFLLTYRKRIKPKLSKIMNK